MDQENSVIFAEAKLPALPVTKKSSPTIKVASPSMGIFQTQLSDISENHENEQKRASLALTPDSASSTTSSGISIHFSTLNIAPKKASIHAGRTHHSKDHLKLSGYFSQFKSKFVNLVKGNSASSTSAKRSSENKHAYLDALKSAVSREQCPLMDDVCYSVYLWLLHVSEEPPEPRDCFIDALQNGKLLFKLANVAVLRPPPCSSKNIIEAYSIHRILWFLNCCVTLAIPEKKIFTPLLLGCPTNDPRPIVATLQLFDAASRSKGWHAAAFPEIQQSYFAGDYVSPIDVRVSKSFSSSLGKEPNLALNFATVDRVQKVIRKSSGAQNEPNLSNSQKSSESPNEASKGHKEQAADSHVSIHVKCTEHISKFMETETRFVEDLKVCCKWQQVVYEGEKISPTDQIAIFRNLLELYDLHNSMYKQMLDLKDVESISIILIQFFESFKRAYSAFNNLQRGADLVFQRAKTSPALSQMLEEFSNWPPAQSVSLEFYLLMLGDHVFTYSNFLRTLNSIIGNTSETSAKALELYEVFNFGVQMNSPQGDSVPVTSELIPSLVEEKDADLGHGTINIRRNINKVVKIRALEKRSRTFLCQGAVWQIIKTTKVKERNLLLFEDVLVISKLVRNDQFEIHSLLSLNLIELLPGNYSPQNLLKLTPETMACIATFNSDPHKGISELIEKEVIDPHPLGIASFLQTAPSLSRYKVGKYLCNPENRLTLVEYIKWLGYSLTVPAVMTPLRIFFSSIRFDNDGSSTDYLLDVFCAVYLQKNTQTYTSELQLRSLVHDILLINMAIHGNATKAILKPQFFESHKGIPETVLHSIYDSILTEELKMASDGTQSINLDPFPASLSVNESISLEISPPPEKRDIRIKVYSPPGLELNPTLLDFRSPSRCKLELKGTRLGKWTLHFFPIGGCHESLMYINPITISVDPIYMKHTFTLKCFDITKNDGTFNNYIFAVSNDLQANTWRTNLQNAIDQFKYKA